MTRQADEQTPLCLARLHGHLKCILPIVMLG